MKETNRVGNKKWWCRPFPKVGDEGSPWGVILGLGPGVSGTSSGRMMKGSDRAEQPMRRGHLSRNGWGSRPAHLLVRSWKWLLCFCDMWVRGNHEGRCLPPCRAHSNSIPGSWSRSTAQSMHLTFLCQNQNPTTECFLVKVTGFCYIY